MCATSFKNIILIIISLSLIDWANLSNDLMFFGLLYLAKLRLPFLQYPQGIYPFKQRVRKNFPHCFHDFINFPITCIDTSIQRPRYNMQAATTYVYKFWLIIFFHCCNECFEHYLVCIRVIIESWFIFVFGRPSVLLVNNFFFFYQHIYTFKTKRYNHQVGKYQCTWDPSKKGLNKEQKIIIYENIY